jgi:L-alanine-DL-glutamate epimerase-like enolase superfamily enzyme
MELSWHRRNLHLRHPFRIARRSEDEGTAKQVLLVCISHGGQTGWGETAPMPYYGQSLDSAEETLAGIAPLLGDDPFALDVILDAVREGFVTQPATIAAIDGALHDLIGKLLGIAVWKLLGLDPRRTPLTSFTIGLDELEVIARKVREAAEYPVLKVKVGTDRDEEILTVIRHEAPDKLLRVDANCGWNSGNVLERCRQMKRFEVELIEQPTAAGDHEGLSAVREAGIGPLFADESCVDLADVAACAGVFDGINIKLSKCGGIRRALEMIHAARALGLKVMLGCMVETSVGIAAAAQLAPLVDCIDLDGHLLLADDPFTGLGGSGGRLTLNEQPGLGVSERNPG